MDAVINLLIQVESRHGKGHGADLAYISSKLHNDKGRIYTIDLIRKMLEFKPRILVSTGLEIQSVYDITPFAKTFLWHGGFAKVAQEIQVQKQLEAEKEKLGLEKLRYEVKNTKRIYKTYWFTFLAAIIGLVISLVLFLLKLLGT